MGYDFDGLIDRHGTCSSKWDGVKDVFGENSVLPLWIADMDFLAPPTVMEAVKKRAAHGIYGYTKTSADFYRSVVSWLERRHGWCIKEEWLVNSPGVVPALALAVRIFTEPGDKVLLQSPVYPPFFSLVQNNDRQVVDCPLILENGRYVMDFERLEQSLDEVKVLLFCSPHNPVGRVWKREELEKLGQLCIKKNVLIISDEIWSDIVFPAYKHLPFAAISDELAARTITCLAPSKTFNIAGLKTSLVVISNNRLLEKFKVGLEKLCLGGISLFGQIATEEAYNSGLPWLEQLLLYLQDNMEFLSTFIAENIPALKIIKPEGTFVGWLDCRGLELPGSALHDFMIHQARVGFVNGPNFGSVGEGFQRINFGCPRSTLQEGLHRVAKAVKNMGK